MAGLGTSCLAPIGFCINNKTMTFSTLIKPCTTLPVQQKKSVHNIVLVHLSSPAAIMCWWYTCRTCCRIWCVSSTAGTPSLVSKMPKSRQAASPQTRSYSQQTPSPLRQAPSWWMSYPAATEAPGCCHTVTAGGAMPMLPARRATVAGPAPCKLLVKSTGEPQL